MKKWWLELPWHAIFKIQIPLIFRFIQQVLVLVIRGILKFLGHSDPFQDQAKIKEEVIKQEKDVDGNLIKKRQLLVFGDDEDLIQMKNHSNPSQLNTETHKAIEQLKAVLDKAFCTKKHYSQFNQRVLSNDQALMNIARYLPEISPKSLKADPTQLV